jgi:hypothetical protein
MGGKTHFNKMTYNKWLTNKMISILFIHCKKEKDDVDFFEDAVCFFLPAILVDG